MKNLKDFLKGNLETLTTYEPVLEMKNTTTENMHRMINAVKENISEDSKLALITNELSDTRVANQLAKDIIKDNPEMAELLLNNRIAKEVVQLKNNFGLIRTTGSLFNEDGTYRSLEQGNYETSMILDLNDPDKVEIIKFYDHYEDQLEKIIVRGEEYEDIWEFRDINSPNNNGKDDSHLFY